MDKTLQTIRLKIAHVDLTDWYEARKKRAIALGIAPYITNVDLFFEAYRRCKNLQEIQAIVDDIKPYKELYNGIYSPIFLRPIHPENAEKAIEQIEFDIKERNAGKVHFY